MICYQTSVNLIQYSFPLGISNILTLKTEAVPAPILYLVTTLLALYHSPTHQFHSVRIPPHPPLEFCTYRASIKSSRQMTSPKSLLNSRMSVVDSRSNGQQMIPLILFSMILVLVSFTNSIFLNLSSSHTDSLLHSQTSVLVRSCQSTTLYSCSSKDNTL